MTTPPDDRAAMLEAAARSGHTIDAATYRTRTRRSLLAGTAGLVGAGLGWRWLQHRPTSDGIPDILRGVLETNENIWSTVSNGRSAVEYDITDASPIQVNGHLGIRDEIDLASWTVRIEGPDGALLDELGIDTFEAMPQRDMITEHRCIEGWSNITHWRGTPFSSLHKRYASRLGDVRYVGLETPDRGYYVGLDIDAALHPQTLLALQQDGAPLDQEHGAPLRLATPNKYGIKCIKRIGVIRFTNDRPADYWAERSYDWYAGL